MRKMAAIKALLKRIEARIDPPPEPEPLSERFAMAFYDAHGAVLARTGNNRLAKLAAAVWATRVNDAIVAGNTDEPLELWAYDCRDNPFGPVELEPGAADALNSLLADVGWDPMRPAARYDPPLPMSRFTRQRNHNEFD